VTLRELIVSDVEDVFLNTDEFAEACTVQAGIFLIDVDLIWDVQADRRRRESQDDETISARAAVVIGSVAQWVFEETVIVPEAGHTIERPSETGDPITYVVFPAFDQHVYRYSDQTRSMLRVYVVPEDDLEEVFYTPPTGDPFMWDVVLGEIRGGEQVSESGDIIKVMRQTAYGPTATLIAGGVTELQRNGLIATSQFTDWSIDLEQSTWGDGRVKLELVRRPIATHRQMESNAAV
jgi:hypothetical protein